jgi:hypothetical protein
MGRMDINVILHEYIAWIIICFICVKSIERVSHVIKFVIEKTLGVL